MESTEFDVTLGGTEHLPNSANSLKFAASRSVEIAAMTESILRPSKTKLIFQCLPVHMRRRVMSHNAKRLPRKLREGHLEQLKKSGLPPKQKRPSRKYRRRPANLLDEYNRRQKRNVWLETHIWHAKRFHMIERWGHRIAYAPCDKAFRACYRASSAHCLIQDISFYSPIQITGPDSVIKDLFSSISSNACGLTVCAKAFTGGKREGSINLYQQNSYPFGYIGKINFIWQSDKTTECLWLFVHPSIVKQVESLLTNIMCTVRKSESYATAGKRRKLMNNDFEKLQIKHLPGRFNRFRLTGPKSHAVLVHSLKCIDDISSIKENKWVSVLNNTNLYLKEKFDYWQNISKANSPSQLPSKMVAGLIVRDPRLSRPKQRTKAVLESRNLDLNSLLDVPQCISTSPLWDIQIHELIKKEGKNNTQFIEHVTKAQMVPGEVYLNDPALQSVPVILIQRPGSQDSNFKKIGYGSGWDVIVPSGYSLQFWQTFIMFGARSGGLRETESLAFEMGECYLPPDSETGKEEQQRIESELKDRYFKLPPSKRVNYPKLSVNSPFFCPWKILLNDWSESSVENFFILRDKQLLTILQDCLKQKLPAPVIDNASSCLVPIYLKMVEKGNLKRHALVCLPERNDITAVKTLFEPHHKDPNEKLRKEKKTEHIYRMKKLKRKRSKLKKKGSVDSSKRSGKQKLKSDPSEYVKVMRELWVPSNVKTVRHTCCRQIIGYLSQAAFSFSESQSCGIGYVPYNALNTLLQINLNQVLVRNVSSKKYRLANITIIQSH